MQQASTARIAGTTVANSAVMLPPELSTKAERTVNQIGEDAAHFIASHDHNEQPGEANRRHRGDRIFRRC
jgi:hypothetical protein